MAHFNQSTDNLVENEQQNLSATPAQSSLSIPQSYGTLDNAPPNLEEGTGGEERTFSGTVTDSPGPGEEFVYKIRQAKAASEDNMTFAFAVAAIIIGSFLWIGCLFGTITVPIAMLVMGAMYINQCPAIPAIPILLVITGTLMTASNLINVCTQFSGSYLARFDERRRKMVVGSANVLLNAFVSAAFIVACIWIYGSSRPSGETADLTKYCHSTLYIFAYWLINFVWIFLLFLFVIGLIGCCCACFA